MKRVGVIALLHESNTFLDRPTVIGDFDSNLLCVGDDVLHAFRGSQHEVGGFLDGLAASKQVEPVGIFAARAMPYGPIRADCWERLMATLLYELYRAGHLDGLLVAPHGATVAEHIPDADGDWLMRVRRHVSDSVPILGTLDLHANVSVEMAAACDALLGYRTNPHLDQYQRGVTAANWMVKTLQRKITPVQALVQLPMCVNIERQATAEPHGQRLWDAVQQQLDGNRRLLDISCLYGFPYADVAEMGASVLAVADGELRLAESAARDVAEFWWAHRQEFAGELIGVTAALQEAATCRQHDPHRPVGLLDMGDNVGGGSPGDGTWLAQAALQRRSELGRVLSMLYDPDVVIAARARGVGATLRCAVGGKTDDLHGPSLEADFVVRAIGEGHFVESAPTHGGYTHFDQGPTAVLESSCGWTVLVTSLRMAPFSVNQITSCGLDPSQFGIVILKGVHAPVAAYASICSRLIRVNTPGVTSADAAKFHFRHRRRPMFPMEPETEFAPIVTSGVRRPWHDGAG